MSFPKRIAVVYGAQAGFGGLGMQAATAIAALAAPAAEVHAFGPGHLEPMPHADQGAAIQWHPSPDVLPRWRRRYTPLRWLQGAAQYEHDRRIGSWAAERVRKLAPDACYVFTQVGLETLRWCREAGVPSVLDNPNGHIRNFQTTYRRESIRWGGSKYLGHPTDPMVERVEEEYRVADRIRVSSQWAWSSMAEGGVPAGKISVLNQPIDLARFRPPITRAGARGPLRLCFVGSLDLRKGFIYLLKAIRALGPERVILEIVGATGDRFCRKLFEREAHGLTIRKAAGDPLGAYHRAELLALPSLEDGFGYVVAEAMACGLPVMVTDRCGAAGLVRPGETGWIVPPGDSSAIVDILRSQIIPLRSELAAIGALARADVVKRHGPECIREAREWFYGIPANRSSAAAAGNHSPPVIQPA